MEIKPYDRVVLKNGEIAVITEILGEGFFVADMGDGPQNWETMTINIDMIEKVL